ncbi:Gluconate 2-dehydrogenase subunit 3 [Spirosomataceae bacterium TFI 002]|nr:Gluconate 2-dehydrogenase subunit 3 [Spirosomataceae bacterium TFI 002]
MKRRDLLKNITLGTAGIAVSGKALASEPQAKLKPIKEDLPDAAGGKQDVEIAHDKKLMEEVFFDQHEMATLAVLSDIIIPADKTSGSATDAGVPDFLEFIVKDMPHYQVPVRGGLRWLDSESRKQKGKRFIDLSAADRIFIVDQIAYPKKAKPEMSQGVNFFNTMRNLVATGFYTSEIGVKDLDFQGNVPNMWDGVPADVLKKHNLSYDDWEKHLAK